MSETEIGNQAMTLLNKAREVGQRGDLGGALWCCQEARRILHPFRQSTFRLTVYARGKECLTRGTALSMLQQYDEAIEAFAEAAQLFEGLARLPTATIVREDLQTARDNRARAESDRARARQRGEKPSPMPKLRDPTPAERPLVAAVAGGEILRMVYFVKEGSEITKANYDSICGIDPDLAAAVSSGPFPEMSATTTRPGMASEFTVGAFRAWLQSRQPSYADQRRYRIARNRMENPDSGEVIVVFKVIQLAAR